MIRRFNDYRAERQRRATERAWRDVAHLLFNRYTNIAVATGNAEGMTDREMSAAQDFMAFASPQEILQAFSLAEQQQVHDQRMASLVAIGIYDEDAV